MSFIATLATESGLSWATIRRYAKSDRLERDDDGRPIHFHSARCPGFCDYACNEPEGLKIAQDVETLEGYLPDSDS